MTNATFGEQMVAQIPYLRAFAISLSGSYSVADDLVQDTLVKAWSHADSFEPGTNFRAWLVTILRNTYFSQYRKRSREVQDSDNVLAEQIPVKGGQESNVTMQDVQKALDKLAPEHREILLMIGITELSYEEAAQVCNIAVGTVKSRLNRARAKLAEHLGLNGTHEIDSDPTMTGIAARKNTKAL
ncbi:MULTISPECIES: sigma-70 family RNA polymerase sigma factor [Methylocystis]|uniref:sigma-70 family RNA polymerase sigma factor n=1 Tax=Methylocystis TaxID=133 RepID=UPI001920DA86|nr:MULTISPECIES: sigma-70 family RNA polymerase sigma factor [Methylocystis]MBL1255277.1 sigma-70 family RNA polymerase sigma factor [Methylocystis sp. Sn-Cys]MDJ0449561.1 sigma-70 family RNA polymerase sigma factor [Methylocystis sp. JR02]